MPMWIDIVNMISGVVVAGATVSIPFIIRWLDKRQRQRQEQVGDSNAMLLKMIDDRIAELIRPISSEDIEQILDGSRDSEKLEQKAYEFVCLKIFATSEEIAKHLELPFEEVVPILLRLSRIEGRIKAMTMTDPETDPGCLWQKS